MTDRPRATFLAICLPHDVREVLRAALGDLPERVDAAWTRPGGWHLTLAWLDRLDNDLAGRVGGAVAPVVAATPGGAARAELTLGDPVRLGRAVGLRVEVPDWLEALQADLVAAVVDGVGAELSERARASLQRRFRPHVTLARARRGGSPERIRDAVARAWSRSLGWSPAGVALLASITGRGPARYEPRARWPIPT